MSFHEKNAWACLVAVLVVYIPYFIYVSRDSFTSILSIVLFTVAVVFLAILLTVFHAVNSILSPTIRETGDKPKWDERDRNFDLRATRVSGIVLGFCVIVWCINAMLRIPLIGFGNMASNASPEAGADLSAFSISAFQAIWWVQALFAGFVFANVVYYATVIFLYRRSS